MATTMFRTLVAGAALAAGSAVIIPGVASATTTAKDFTSNQQQLEQQLAYRASQLTRLSADVTGSTTLSSSDASVLSARISTESADINALVQKVPTDTTNAELFADRQAMIKDNRVFAVLTPQVLEIIEADAISAQATTAAANETTLEAAVNSLTGQPSFNNAERHYTAYVTAVTNAQTWTAGVVTSVIAQMPSDFPGDTHVFVHANHALLNADVALAHAAYDASIIGLASGGYTGS
jgi:hypothetical protein